VQESKKSADTKTSGLAVITSIADPLPGFHPGPARPILVRRPAIALSVYRLSPSSSGYTRLHPIQLLSTTPRTYITFTSTSILYFYCALTFCCLFPIFCLFVGVLLFSGASSSLLPSPVNFYPHPPLSPRYVHTLYSYPLLTMNQVYDALLRIRLRDKRDTIPF